MYYFKKLNECTKNLLNIGRQTKVKGGCTQNLCTQISSSGFAVVGIDVVRRANSSKAVQCTLQCTL